jgi:catabolite regulation protein CreA
VLCVQSGDALRLLQEMNAVVMARLRSNQMFFLCVGLRWKQQQVSRMYKGFGHALTRSSHSDVVQAHECNALVHS